MEGLALIADRMLPSVILRSDRPNRLSASHQMRDRELNAGEKTNLHAVTWQDLTPFVFEVALDLTQAAASKPAGLCGCRMYASCGALVSADRRAIDRCCHLSAKFSIISEGVLSATFKSLA